MLTEVLDELVVSEQVREASLPEQDPAAFQQLVKGLRAKAAESAAKALMGDGS